MRPHALVALQVAISYMIDKYINLGPNGLPEKQGQQIVSSKHLLTVLFVNVSYFFERISSYERFLAKRLVVDTESPSGHVGRGPVAIRAPR